MKNRIIFMLICCFALWSGTALQAEDIFNPENPGDPQAGLLKYSLNVSVTPQQGGETNFTVSKNRAGAEVYLSAYSNTNYIFKYWQIGDSIVSANRSFYYIMPQHDVDMIAVFEPYFNPDSPEDPQVGLKKYSLTIVSSPSNGGSTNYISWRGREHDRVYLEAYPNTNYAFVHWLLGDSIVSYNGWFEYEMPAENVTLTAVFKPYFNPENPADPNANYWNETTGEVIIDKFEVGDLRGAIDRRVDNLDQITMLTVVGEMSSYDFGAVNNYSSCILFDLSRTSGYTEVPNYAFEYNHSLQKVILPSMVEKIGYDAFYNCSALNEIHLYATTPPDIDDNTFYGTHEGIVIKVLPAAIPLYMQHEKWKNFIILPLDEEVSAITVNFPEGIELSKFKNFSLEMLNQANGQRYKYIISDRDSYSFSGLVKNATYSVSLKNRDGVVFGEIKDIELKENDTTVFFEKVLIPQTLTVSVLTPEKVDVTAQTQISWFAADGSFIKRASSIDGYIEGDVVRYSIVLGKELAIEYENPMDAEYVVGDDNNITIVLKPFDLVHLRGEVRDSLNNTVLANATISISQQLNGKYSKSYIATTDANGVFEVDVFDVYSNLTISANEYISRKVEYAKFDAESVDLGVFKIRSITGAIVDLKFTYTHSVIAGSDVEVEEYYSDYNNVSYSIYNKTQQKAITNFSVQYPKIVLLEEVKEGDVLVLDVYSRKNSFTAIQTEATIHGDRATAEINVLQLGGVDATYTSTENRTVIGILYDAKGEMIKKSEYNSGLWSIKDLQDGEYTLVSMGKSTLFNDMYNLSAFANVGLIEGVDYVANKIVVASGVISTIVNEVVPKFDESKLYYTGSNTTFGVNKTSITVGNYLTLRAKIDFKNEFVGSVENLNLVIDLPESISFVENSVMLGSTVASYTVDGNRLIIPVGMNELVRFCIIPTASGSYAPTAFAQFDIEGKTVMQPIGSANFSVKDLTITVPQKTNDKLVYVKGESVGNSKVFVYDNNVLIGETSSLANGVWSIKVELQNVYEHSYHQIHAVVENKDKVFQTETKEIVYDANYINLKSVQMLFGEYDFVFDYENPSNKQLSYTWPTCGEDFTFIINFTKNDTNKISNVKLNILTSDQRVVSVVANYSAKHNSWIVNKKFPDNSQLPVNFTVDFDKYDEVFNDSIRKEEQYDNIYGYMLDIRQRIDSLMEFDLVEDEENYCVYDMYSSFTEEVVSVRLEMLDFESINLSDGFVLVVAEKDSMYIKEVPHDAKYEAIVWDVTYDMCYSMALSRNEESSSVIKRASKLNWSKLNKNISKANDIIESLLPYGEYMRGVKDYEYWVERMEDIDEDLLFDSELTAKMLLAKCSDNTLKLTQDKLDEYYKRKQDIDQLHSNFTNAAYSMLDLWSDKLLNAFYLETLTFSFGKVAKMGAKTGKVLKNSKNANYFQYDIRDKKLRESTEDLIENSFDLYMEGLDMSGALDFADYNSMSEEFSNWVPKSSSDISSLYDDLQSDILRNSKCKEDEGTEQSEDEEEREYVHPNVVPIIDPSGYVYEGVPSNRLEGVMASCYYKEVVEDMYGDKHENIVLWDAENYAQENPLFTDENGMYRWDVPQGLWQVKFEKEGYQTTYSEWLPVPPPQLEVNIAMVQNSQPEVSAVRAYENGIEIDFDKYMNIETLNNTNIVVTKNNEAIEGAIVLLNEEFTSENSFIAYASKVRFNPSVAFLTTDEITLTVSKKVKSYANIQMATDYTQSFSITKEVDSIAVDSVIVVDYGTRKDIVVSVLPFDAAIGKNLIVTSTSSLIASVVNDTIEIDEAGQVVLSILGELPGTTTIKMSVEGEDRGAQTIINVVNVETPVVMVDKPEASIISGKQVPYGTEIRLSCATQDAMIYYTIDGSCPCGDNRIKYVAPIKIERDVVIKAIAVLDTLESAVVEFVYKLQPYKVTIVAENGVVVGDDFCLHGDTITLKAVANEGYHFVGWTDGVVELERSIVVTSDTTFTAEFAINVYRVTLSAGEGGTVSGGGEYNHGAIATLVAVNNAGYRFVCWSDGDTSPERTIEVTADIILEALFEKDQLVDIDDVDSKQLMVYANNQMLFVEGANANYYVLDTSGKVVYCGESATITLPIGVYIVVFNDEIHKIVVR